MKCFRILFLLLPISMIAQDYNDVAVLMNTNDLESVMIGEYYQMKNNIPDENMIYVVMPTTERIDSSQIASILSEVQVQLDAHSNESEINYIVTTKGCPTVIDTPWELWVPERPFEVFFTDFVISSIWSSSAFNRPLPFAETGFRIVSRLEAGTLEGAFRLIDRGGLQSVDLSLGVILDLYAPFNFNNSSGTLEIIKEDLVSHSDNLNLFLEINSILDTMTTYFSSEADVAIYSQVGVGSVPVAPFVEKTKSLAMLSTAHSALKSNYGVVLTVFDFLESDCSVAFGFATENGSSVINQSVLLIDYLHPNIRSTIGESAYHVMNYRRPFVLFGDPKSKVSEITSVSNLDRPIVKDIYPIPTSDYVNIDFKNQKERILTIYDINGILLHTQVVINQKNRINISALPNGFLFVGIKEGDQVDVRKIIKF